MSEWSVAMRERLKTLWTEGLSGSEIAGKMSDEFGIRLSRSAILGASDRMGLERRKKVAYYVASPKRERPAASVARAMPTPRPPKARKPRNTFVVRHPAVRSKAEDELPADTATLARIEREKPETFLGLTLMELGPHHCRYPRGGNDGSPILFCGQPTLADKSYCAACHRRCHSGTQFISDAERERRRLLGLRQSGINNPGRAA